MGAFRERGGDAPGSAFAPTKANLFAAVKAIFHPSTNAGVSADDGNNELDVAAAAAAGGDPRLTQVWSQNISLAAADRLTRSQTSQATLRSPGAGEIYAASVRDGSKRSPLALFLAADLEAVTAADGDQPSDSNSIEMLIGDERVGYLSKDSLRRPLFASNDADVDPTPLTISRLLAPESAGDGSYTLPAATESVLGGVRAATSAQATSGNGSTVLGWTVNRLRSLIQAALPTISQADATTGTSSARRAWTALRVRQAVNAVHTKTAWFEFAKQVLLDIDVNDTDETLGIPGVLISHTDPPASNEIIQFNNADLWIKRDGTRPLALWRYNREVLGVEDGWSKEFDFDAVVPAVFRTGNADRIDVAKLGSGTASADTALFGDGAWKAMAASLMEELFNDHTAAISREWRVGTFVVPNDGNVVLLVSVNGNLEFFAGDDFVALRESDATTLDGVTLYSNADRHFLIKQPTNTSRLLRIWIVEDVQAFASIAARFLPTVTEADATGAVGTATARQRRIWTVERVVQAIRANRNPDSLTGLSVSGSVLTGTRQGGTSPVEVNLGAASGSNFRLAQIGSRYTATTEDDNYRATGIIAPAIDDEEILYVRFGAEGDGTGPLYWIMRGATLNALTVKSDGDPRSVSDTTWHRSEPNGLSLIHVVKTATNELLLGDDGGLTAPFWMELYGVEIGDDSPVAGDVGAAVVAAVKMNLQDVAQTALTSSYGGAFFKPTLTGARWNIGGFTLDGDKIVIPVAGMYQIHTEALFVSGGGRNTVYTRYRIERNGAVIAQSVSEGTSYHRGASPNNEAVVEHDDWHRLEAGDELIVDNKGSAATQNYTVTGSRSLVVLVGFAVADVSTPPSITDFTLTGDLSPAAGDIGGESYGYSTAFAHSDQLAAARLVGFAGTSPSGAVVVLKTFTAAEYHAAAGSITLPGTINLAAGESYTVRLEGYTAGQTVGTDTPAARQDRRITAHAAAASVRFIRVPRRVAGARPTAANLVANATVISRKGSVIDSWVVAGIPDDNQAWLVGWIVPQSGAQPNHYTLGGIDNDAAFVDAFDLTENGVDYNVYLNTDAGAGDENYNGVTIVVT